MLCVSVQAGDAEVKEMGESVQLSCKAERLTSPENWEWYKADSDPEKSDPKLEEGEKYSMHANSTTENTLTIKDIGCNSL